MPNKIKKNLIVLLSILIVQNICPIKIDRVILSTNENQYYIEFWPIVAKIWKEFIGVKPTLALIADNSVQIDDKIGDVIRFDPIQNISTSLYAQCIRLLLPAYFENDVCIISDIDMIPINKKFFIEQITEIPNDNFILLTNELYESSNSLRFPMCYNIAKGNVFKEIFNILDTKKIPEIIKLWHSLNYLKCTDEKILYNCITSWKNYNTKFKKLNYKVCQRIDRSAWNFYSHVYNKLDRNTFIDIHCPRPYSKYKNRIGKLVNFFIGDK